MRCAVSTDTGSSEVGQLMNVSYVTSLMHKRALWWNTLERDSYRDDMQLVCVHSSNLGSFRTSLSSGMLNPFCIRKSGLSVVERASQIF